MSTPAVPLRCWCGNAQLHSFSPDYLRCAACDTLVLAAEHRSGVVGRVRDDDGDFYGREYWFSHQSGDMNVPEIHSRMRSDLPERCAYWLNSLLDYKLPPARAIELGSAHGGFVALLNQAGFDATGLELSPSIVELARQTFEVPVLVGPVEDQPLKPRSLDLVVMMDVLEHLPDPRETCRACVELLKDDGLLFVQTPCYPGGESLDQAGAMDSMIDARFALHLRPPEHVHLFSRRSAVELFRGLGVPHVQFLPAIFPFYDMFFVVSRRPIAKVSPEQRTAAMSRGAGRRMIQALLDGETRFRDLLAKHRRLLSQTASLRAEVELLTRQAEPAPLKLSA